MSPEVAMEQYVSLLSDKDPGWMEGQTSVSMLLCKETFQILTEMRESCYNNYFDFLLYIIFSG